MLIVTLSDRLGSVCMGDDNGNSPFDIEVGVNSQIQ